MRIDPRAGSGPLVPLMRARGVRDVTAAMLTAGDISIEGRGPEGCPVSVGIEYKKLGDLIQCIENGRLVAGQLPAMLDSYEVIWLLVEGIWRENLSSGLIEVPRGPSWKLLPTGRAITASALQGFLMTLQQKVGIKVMLTGTTPQTVDWLFHLNRWWTNKAWEEHRANLAFDNSAAVAHLLRPNLVRRVAKELPGVGMDRSAAVARTFTTVQHMVLAEVADWESIAGIGKVTARRVVDALTTEGA